jgi:hypothetical protein
MHSPNASHYWPGRGNVRASEQSIEVSAQAPLTRQFFVIGGFGYAHLAGEYSQGYNYWSAGGGFSFGPESKLAPASLLLQYIDTSSEAQRVYYDAAVHKRLTGTAIWRF